MPPAPEILVVDDDRPLRSLLVTILKRQGFSVAAAGNGLEALERMNDHRFDLLLLDLMMPRMNGYELIEHLARTHRDDLPAIVVLSGTTTPYEAPQDLAVDALQKPFDVDALVAAVRASLARHAAHVTGTPFDRLDTGSQPTVH